MDQKSTDVQDEPFSCATKGCNMTFTNKDHLEWHNKKHDMMLNLGLVNKTSEIGDQTPTPTRFIRNCEEVGLFQDLQNINPFDEIFKKAADLAKNGVSIEFQECNSNDTLHTPHILPHITELTNKSSISDCVTDKCDIVSDNNKTNIELTLVNNKEAKNLKKGIINKKSPVIKVVPLQCLKKPSNNLNENGLDSQKRLEKIREQNRAAQFRCRKKKQMKWKDLIEENKKLRDANNMLRMQLQALTVEHSKCLLEKSKNVSVLTPMVLPKSSQTVSSASQSQAPILLQIIPTPILPTTVESNLSSDIASDKNIVNIVDVKKVTADKVSLKMRTYRQIAPQIKSANS